MQCKCDDKLALAFVCSYFCFLFHMPLGVCVCVCVCLCVYVCVYILPPKTFLLPAAIFCV